MELNYVTVILMSCCAVFDPAPVRRAEYFDAYISVCVCLSARISPDQTTGHIFQQFYYDCGSLVLWQRCVASE